MKNIFIFILIILCFSGCTQIEDYSQTTVQPSNNSDQNPFKEENSIDIASEISSSNVSSNDSSIDESKVLLGTDQPITEIVPELMEQVKAVGDWIYFLYPDSVYPEYLALFRYRQDETNLSRLSTRTDIYYVINNNVYFIDFPYMVNDHGTLYYIELGSTPKEIANELFKIQIVNDEYIYYVHAYDTMGVGIEGHSLYRINLDGSNKMIVAYETSGIGIEGSHFDFYVKDKYAYLGNICISMGEPADGTETIKFIGEPTQDYIDDGWIYYTTNKLMKSKNDGSEKILLASSEDPNSWISIIDIDDQWIYYTEYGYNKKYKIRKDGTDKTPIDIVAE